MSKKPLGRLKPVELREYWSREDTEFTPWLGSEENIALLGETLGLSLEVMEQEASVGPFRADIVCRDVITDARVLIENQLEPTDHGHLGQLLTYAAGLDAVRIIWIAAEFRDQHRATLDWLNEITDERAHFFGVEVELWRIGESVPAPKFNLVSKPNDWTKTIRTGLEKGYSETQRMQREFWTGFKTLLEGREHVPRIGNPPTRHWMGASVGRTGFVWNLVLSTWNREERAYRGELRAELYINNPDAKRYHDLLEQQRAGLEEQVGEPLGWWNPEDSRACSIFLRRDADPADRPKWPEYQAWLLEAWQKLDPVLRPAVKELEL